MLESLFNFFLLLTAATIVAGIIRPGPTTIRFRPPFKLVATALAGNLIPYPRAAVGIVTSAVDAAQRSHVSQPVGRTTTETAAVI